MVQILEGENKFHISFLSPGPICKDFRMILKINLAAIFPSKNCSTMLSKNSACRARSHDCRLLKNNSFFKFFLMLALMLP